MSRPAAEAPPALEPGLRRLLAASIDRDQSAPAYSQIADAIRKLVVSGTLAAGTILPAETVLCDEFGVSRMTLRQAYDVLEREHILHRQRGRGTTVAPQRMRKQQQEMRSFTEEIRARGGKPHSRMLSFKTVRPSDSQRVELALPAAQLLYCIRRLRFSDATPLAIEEVHLPCYLCESLDCFDLEERSLYTVLEGEYGLRLAHSLETISAALPSTRDRKLLQLPRATAVLTIERKTYTESGTPVEIAVTTYRGDLYQAVVHSMRAKSNSVEGT